MKIQGIPAICILALAFCTALCFCGCRSSLTSAAVSGDLDQAEKLLAKGQDVNEKDLYGWTPLMWAVYYGQDPVAEFLLKKGANPNICSSKWCGKIPPGSTALMIAAYYGRLSDVTLLLDHGASRDTKNSHGHTALTYAQDFEFEDVAKRLESKNSP